VRSNEASRLAGVCALALILAVSACGQTDKSAGAADLRSFFAKPELTIAVTDSGLGGLSIMAETAARLKDARAFKSVNFVFFNALFSNDSGYNSLRSREEKIAVFNAALESLAAKFRPDMILVGCNTLSVITAETPFFKAAKIPVLDIVGPGVDLMLEQLIGHPETTVIIFGTETTIAEGEYQRKLLEWGLPEEHLISQACPELASYIEKDPKGEDTALLIDSFVDEALAKVKDKNAPLLASLNCTHFGYSGDLWTRAFESRGVKSFRILNPNTKMAEAVAPPAGTKKYARTAITAKAVSMVEISREKVEALGPALRRVSPETAEALARYELKPDLFEWKSLIK